MKIYNGYITLASLLLICSLPACTWSEEKAGDNSMVEKSLQIETTPTGLQYIILSPASDTAALRPQKGQNAEVHYTGWLYDETAADNKGKKFDSSVDRGTPFAFPVGMGRVIKGWDEGVALMQVGEKRRLIIPAELGYGARGAGAVIPANAKLVFDVELLAVK